MKFYRPREDSYLLKECVESLDLEDKKLLDMGTGTGIIAIVAAENGAEVTAADINPDALEVAERKACEAGISERTEFVETDLFKEVEGGFDYITFNPPYLSGEREGEKDPLVGGEGGTEIIQRFLSEAGSYLKPGGEVFFIASSQSNIDLLDRPGLEQLETRQLWFETLYLFRINNSFL